MFCITLKSGKEGEEGERWGVQPSLILGNLNLTSEVEDRSNCWTSFFFFLPSNYILVTEGKHKVGPNI